MLTTYLTTINIWTYITTFFAVVFINNDMVFFLNIIVLFCKKYEHSLYNHDAINSYKIKNISLKSSTIKFILRYYQLSSKNFYIFNSSFIVSCSPPQGQHANKNNT